MGRNIIHVSRLAEFVTIGDVILFKSANFVSGIQRAATRSEWDHCGIVVSKSHGQLYLLESTGDGVGCYPFTNRIRAYGIEFAQYMAVRRIIGPPRRRQFQTKLREFTAQVNGAKYKLDFKKLVSSQPLEKSLDSKKGGFFCSELVAAAWQELNIMKDDKAPNAYWPTDFEEGGNIEKSFHEKWALESIVLIDTRVNEVARASKHVYAGGESGESGESEGSKKGEAKSTGAAGRFG